MVAAIVPRKRSVLLPCAISFFYYPADFLKKRKRANSRIDITSNFARQRVFFSFGALSLAALQRGRNDIKRMVNSFCLYERSFLLFSKFIREAPQKHKLRNG